MFLRAKELILSINFPSGKFLWRIAYALVLALLLLKLGPDLGIAWLDVVATFS